MKSIQILLFWGLVFVSFIGYAQKIATGGDWNTDANWTPFGVPAATDNVTIPVGITVAIANTGMQANSITINSGELIIDANADLTVDGGNLVLYETGKLTINTSGKFYLNGGYDLVFDSNSSPGAFLTVNEGGEAYLTGSILQNTNWNKRTIRNSGFLEIQNYIYTEALEIFNYEGGALLVHGNISGIPAGSGLKIYNYGIITIDNNRSLSGTITCNTASTAVSGSSSAFLTELLPGDYIVNANSEPVGRIASIADNSNLTLTANSRTTNTTSDYYVTFDLYNSYFYNFATAKFITYGSIIHDVGSSFNNQGVTQCNTFFVVGNAAGGSNGFDNKEFKTHAHGMTGTITTNNTSAVIVGTGTYFTKEVYVGFKIYNGATLIGTVTSIEDDTHLTLTANATTTLTDVLYQVETAIGAGTLITLEDFIVDESIGCFTCDDTKLGEVLYNGIDTYNGSGQCTFPNCADWLLSLSNTNLIAPGRRLWLNASYIGAGLQEDGEQIYRWFDLANSFGFKMAQSNSANMPVLKNNASDNVNYNPVVSFYEDDANYLSMDLDDNYLYAPNADGGMAIFAVIVPGDDSSPIDDQLFFDFGEYSANGYGMYYSDQNYGFYTPGLVTSTTGHNRADKPTIFTQRVQWASSPEDQNLYIDGQVLQTVPIGITEISASNINENATAAANSGPVTIGKNSTSLSSNEFDGKIAEIIVYARNLSFQDRLATETYLALKYGINKSEDYLDYNLNQIFDVTTEYRFDIIGLAREDLNLLNQKITTSIENPAELILSTNETVAVNNDDISTPIENNSSYLILGHNGSNLGNGRVYKVEATNFNQSVTLQFTYPNGFSSAPSMFIDDNDAFSSPVEINTGVLSGGNTVLTFTHTFTNNTVEYFYLDIPCTQVPGGVCNNLELWLNSETIAQADNSEVTTWTDMSASGFDANNTTTTGPHYQTEEHELINFHPTVEFDGTTNELNLGSNYIYSKGNGGMTIFSVVQPDTTSSKPLQFIYDFGAYNQGYGLAYGYENIMAYTNVGAGGSMINEVHTKQSKPVIAGSHLVFLSNHELMIDGEIYYDDESSNIALLEQWEVPAFPESVDFGGPVSIGRQSKNQGIDWSGGRRFDGKMTELLLYNTTLSDAEMQKIDTYLAIKYGICLTKNYVNSSDIVVWDRTSNSGYNFDIAGIMRDDNSAIDQRQSGAVNLNEILTIGKGIIAATNAANPNAFGTDLDCFLWGSNGGATIATGTTEKPGGVYDRIGREWKVVEPNNNTGTLRIQFDLSNNGTVSDVNHLRLLVDADGDFSNATIVGTAFTQSGNSYYVDQDLNNGEYFTLATTNALTPLKSFSVTEPGMGINTETVDPSAELHVAESSGAAGDRFKGVLLPRMDNVVMLAIAAPPTGLIVFNTDHKRFMYNAGTPNIPKWTFIGSVLVQTSRQLATQVGYYIGEMRYNDTTDTIWYWDGTNWVEIDNN